MKLLNKANIIVALIFTIIIAIGAVIPVFIDGTTDANEIGEPITSFGMLLLCIMVGFMALISYIVYWVNYDSKD